MTVVLLLARLGIHFEPRRAGVATRRRLVVEDPRGTAAPGAITVPRTQREEPRTSRTKMCCTNVRAHPIDVRTRQRAGTGVDVRRPEALPSTSKATAARATSMSHDGRQPARRRRGRNDPVAGRSESCATTGTSISAEPAGLAVAGHAQHPRGESRKSGPSSTCNDPGCPSSSTRRSCNTTTRPPCARMQRTIRATGSGRAPLPSSRRPSLHDDLQGACPGTQGTRRVSSMDGIVSGEVPGGSARRSTPTQIVVDLQPRQR